MSFGRGVRDGAVTARCLQERARLFAVEEAVWRGAVAGQQPSSPRAARGAGREVLKENEHTPGFLVAEAAQILAPWLAQSCMAARAHILQILAAWLAHCCMAARAHILVPP